MRIAVAGGGIAGLTTAIALSSRGFTVDLYERAAEPRELGAGIQLSPNATAILIRLGLEPALRPYVSEPVGIDIHDGRSGRGLTRIPLGAAARKRYGAPYYLIHRGDLHGVLVKAAQASPNVELHFGAEVDDASSVSGRAVFRVRGEERHADLLVVADGVRSRLRDTFGYPPARPLTKTAWRGTLTAAQVPRSVPLDATGLWLVSGAHLVHYPLRAGALLNVVLIAEGLDSSSAPPLTGFAPVARRLAERVGDWTAWPLRVVEPAGPWARGRLVLVGDAAHAMSPSAAQGGAQAIEDAWALASLLARESDLATALARFDAIRRPRAERIAREALRNLRIYNLRGVAAHARNIAIAALPPASHLRRLDWVYAPAQSAAAVGTDPDLTH